MTIKLYVLPSCTSSRKARTHFEDNNIEFDMQVMTHDHVTWEQFIEMLSHAENGLEDIISVRSAVYKNLVEEGIDFEDMVLSEVHYATQKHPTILKSPITIGNGKMITGYNKELIQHFDSNRRGKRQMDYMSILDKLRITEDNAPIGV